MTDNNGLGEWRWYSGSDEDDDEMCECASKEEAIRHGLRDFAPDSFYIVEARMKLSDEIAMADGSRDTAPFAETRSGEFVSPAPPSPSGDA
jgi:hypothetical protein